MGCNPSYPPDSLVEKPRILGVKAEPPEASQEEAISLSALVVCPTGVMQVQPKWSICFEPEPCAEENEYRLDSTSVLKLPDFFNWLASYNPLYKEQVLSGWRTLFVRMTIETPELVSTYATKVVSIQSDPLVENNRNPRFIALESNNQRYAHQSRIDMLANNSLSLACVMSKDSQKALWHHKGQNQQEVLLYSWFSTGGAYELNDRTKAFNTWFAPQSPGQYWLWVVVRDGRLGLDWIEIRVLVHPDSDKK
jgi:hypothetical protein